ncbi:glycosyltransferase family 39 protein [Paracoccus sp. (in: a-proteobacteria)]|uniref:ArnT family glycosyltransferase n=1 Tax=Paracoccus sp. TaxID=267 RepID=UPI0026DF3DD0|nr:glycosyltransferase family 39 protein [Paracoccus sp. (in: a-proteobacteria)]MDO5646990.1 glycosyltransferase family 39 protein [Paracoccus sp. (in: a-proteobacteria)]
MRPGGTDRWLPVAAGIVAVAVALRLLSLALSPTDVFVDESQYWLWGQRFDFGYYSKPPAIAWLIGAVTTLAGSDAAFWLRAPAPVLHGITALILAGLAAQIAGARAAIWTAAVYVTLPFVAVGSALISTDTVMAPFWAGALLFGWRAAQGGRARDALIAGLCGGAAFLGKYAAMYLIPGLALAALFSPVWRPGWRNAALMGLGFAAVAAPNLIWNMAHDLTTFEHTADNIGWVRHGAGLNLSSMAEFAASQFAVFGPVTMAALLVAMIRARGAQVGLVMLTLPPLVAVLTQALLDKAYANWAIAAYFAGTVLVVTALSARWLRVAVAVNLIPSVLLPVLIAVAPWPVVNGQPVLVRYLGRADLSQQIIAAAQTQRAAVLAVHRDILADLFYTGRDAGVAFYAPQPQGRARNYYEQTFAIPDALTGPVLVVAGAAPCPGAQPIPLTGRGVWQGRALSAWLTDADCARGVR